MSEVEMEQPRNLKESEAQKRDHMLDHTLEETFPASDPPSTDPDPLPDPDHEDKQGE